MEGGAKKSVTDRNEDNVEDEDFDIEVSQFSQIAVRISANWPGIDCACGSKYVL